MPEDFDWSGLDQIIKFPHGFELELHHLVTSNHRLVLQAINTEEDVELATVDLQNPDDPDARDGISNSLQNFYEDLRRAANNLAVVALVTRLQHWMNKFAGRPKTDRRRGLASALGMITAKVGAGPVPAKFFDDLVTVRDSVIHGDGQKSWEFPPGKIRTVAPEYVNAFDEVEIREDQLKDAIAKSIDQIQWFDKRLEEWRASQQTGGSQ